MEQKISKTFIIQKMVKASTNTLGEQSVLFLKKKEEG